MTIAPTQTTPIAFPSTGVLARRAIDTDVEAIALLISRAAATGKTLPRSSGEIAESVGRFSVAIVGDELVGCASLEPVSSTLAEVRSVVVAQEATGLGVGREVMGHLIEQAHLAGVRQLCLLTMSPGFFERLGFVEVRAEDLPVEFMERAILGKSRSILGRTAMMLEPI